MKLTRLFLPSTLLLGIVVSADAQVAEPADQEPATPEEAVFFHVSAGAANPQIQGLEDSWTGGFALSGGAHVFNALRMMGNWYVAARAEVGLAVFPMDHAVFTGSAQQAEGLTGGTMTALSAMVLSEVDIPLGPLSPYATLGVGYISYFMSDLKRGDQTFDAPKLESQPSLTGGLGARVRLGPRLGLFGEARFLTTLGGDAYFPTKFGVLFR